jgi:hypothetical protein
MRSLTPSINGFSGPRTTARPLNIVSIINFDASTLILANLLLSRQLSKSPYGTIYSYSST